MNELKPLNSFLTQTEDIADRVNSMLINKGLKPSYEDIQLEEVVNFFGGILNYVSSDKENNGFIHIKKEKKFTIFINRENGLLNNRFIIAHELGHYFLHYLLQDIKGEAIAGMYGNSKIEDEANDFATSFLIPRGKAIEEFKKMNKYFTPNDELGVIKKMAAFFSVSIDTMRKRWYVISSTKT